MATGRDYPHVPAAHVNALAEEGTRAELIDWLQKQWNEICWLRGDLARLRGEVDERQRILNALGDANS